MRAAIKQRWGEQMLRCVDDRKTEVRLNQHLHFASDNSIPVLDAADVSSAPSASATKTPISACASRCASSRRRCCDVISNAEPTPGARASAREAGLDRRGDRGRRGRACSCR